MISTLFWVAVGIVIKTLVPMPWVDVFIRNLYAKALGYAQEFYTPTTTSTTTATPTPATVSVTPASTPVSGPTGLTK